MKSNQSQAGTAGTLHVIKDGKIKLSIPYELTGGFPNFQGKYLVSKEACGAGGIDPKTLVSKVPISATEKYYLRMGVNPDGNEIIDDDDYRERGSRLQVERESVRRAALTPEQRSLEDKIREGLEAWNEIDRLQYLSHKALTRDTDDMNVDRGYRLQAEASSKAKVWAEKYPEAAAVRRAEQMKSQATELQRQAVGALLYDADGWLSKEDQKKSHDSLMRQAAELIEKAKQEIA